MGQWGAKGMADAGRTYREILAHYYAGVTFAARAATEDIRVLVRESTTAVLTSDDPFTLKWSTGASIATSDATYRYWRVSYVSSTYKVERATTYKGPWAGVATGSAYVVAKPGRSFLQVVATDGSSHYYRGSMELRAAYGLIRHIDVLPIRDYLYGVVPRESPASWPAEELKAQALAARSYATYKKDNARARGTTFDICATTSCQVYGGYAWKRSPTATMTALEYASSNAAVNAVAGSIMLSSGKPILAEFSSSSGGYSAPGTVSYLKAVADPSDAVSPNHDWTARVSVSQIEAHWPQIGRLLDLTVTQRNGYGDWGGRVSQMNLVGTTGTVSISGGSFAGTFAWPDWSTGLRGSWFRPLYWRGEIASVPTSVSVVQGDATTVVARIKNTGTAYWPVRGSVRLTASSARFYGTGWISSTRAATVASNVTVPSAPSVGPGQIAEFRIPLHGNTLPPGMYTERFNAIADGYSTMTPSFSIQIQVLRAWTDEAPNLLTNGSFESGNSSWTGSGLGRGDGSSTSSFRDGTHAFVVGGGSKTIVQSVGFAGGARRFTLGGWSRTVGSSASGGPVELLATATYTDGSQTSWELSLGRAPHAWRYGEMSFATRSYKSLASVRVVAAYVRQKGTGYFDAIRLLETPLVNSSFESGMAGWSWAGLGHNDGAVEGARDGARSLQIVGAAGAKTVTQRIALKGLRSERFVLSIWNRTASTNSTGPITGALTFENTDGSATTGTLSFTGAAHDWTYAETTVRASKPFESALITLNVTDQVGTVGFDAVRVARTWIDDSSFEEGAPSWRSYGWTSGDGIGTAVAREGARSLSLAGAGKQGYVQSNDFTGRAGRRFIVSGWTRSAGTSVSGGTVGFIIVIRNTDGTKSGFTVGASKAAHPWSYSEALIVAPKAFTRIDLYAVFYDQTGSANFDGVRLRNA
jgi:SpoIID/LytB domain protein